MNRKPPRIWVSTDTPAPGEIVRVRAQIAHPMETGFRFDAAGNNLPQNTLHRFRALTGDELVLDWLPERSIAQNPYIEFTFVARQSGPLRMIWTDDSGDFATAEREITVG